MKNKKHFMSAGTNGKLTEVKISVNAQVDTVSVFINTDEVFKGEFSAGSHAIPLDATINKGNTITIIVVE